VPITVQPTEIPRLRCPRCRFDGAFIPNAPLVWRCTRCEWPFTLGAATVTVPTASPVSNTVYTNSSGTVVAATITTASGVTAITVNGVSTGQTSGTVFIPRNGTISITWATTQPTMTWALPAISAGVPAAGLALPFTAWGTCFALGQVLIVDPAGTSDVVTVSGTPTGTSVPVSALNSSHLTGVLVTVAQASTYLSSVENVPQTAY
jgi:ribosomal protein L37AE/L43A